MLLGIEEKLRNIKKEKAKFSLFCFICSRLKVCTFAEVNNKNIEKIMYRTKTCGELRLIDAGKEVVLAGWVQRSRKMGGMTFVDFARPLWYYTTCI